jgi:hypothetical protein
LLLLAVGKGTIKDPSSSIAIDPNILFADKDDDDDDEGHNIGMDTCVNLRGGGGGMSVMEGVLLG